VAAFCLTTTGIKMTSMDKGKDLFVSNSINASMAATNGLIVTTKWKSRV